jgi:uncharacterized membrane protein
VSWILRNFFRGLLAVVPIAATAYVIWVIFTKLNQLVFARLGGEVARRSRLEEQGWLVTALGVVATVALVTVVGVLVSNFVGRAVVKRLEGLLAKLPLVKLLYGSIKDLLGAFVGEKKGFDRPVLVTLSAEGPTQVVGFVTRESLDFLGVAGRVAVYLPQSYNFAGNLLVVPAERVQPLRADSSDVMAFLVSGGVAGSSAS